MSDDRSPYSSAEIFSLFAENNMEITDSTMLTPALRFDHHTIVGNNWSPSLNLSQALGDDFTLKMGIARAYKAPSLYQTNPNYLLYSKGQGCYASSDGVGCYMMGNDDLKAETSVNKEIGLEWKHDGWQAGVTWFVTTTAIRLKRAMRQSAIPLQVKCKPISTSGKTCRRLW